MRTSYLFDEFLSLLDRRPEENLVAYVLPESEGLATLALKQRGTKVVLEAKEEIGPVEPVNGL